MGRCAANSAGSDDTEGRTLAVTGGSAGVYACSSFYGFLGPHIHSCGGSAGVCGCSTTPTTGLGQSRRQRDGHGVACRWRACACSRGAEPTCVDEASTGRLLMRGLGHRVATRCSSVSRSICSAAYSSSLDKTAVPPAHAVTRPSPERALRRVDERSESKSISDASQRR